MKAFIDPDKTPTPVGPYLPGLSMGEWIFLSGRGGFDPQTGNIVSDDLIDHTEQTLSNLETLLEATSGLRAEITGIANTA